MFQSHQRSKLKKKAVLSQLQTRSYSLVTKNMSRKDEYSSIWIVGLLILAMNANQASGISCVDAITRLMPCLPFLLSTSSSVTVPCCEGAASLSQLVGSDRVELKSMCECLKQTATSMRVNVDRAEQLPQLCNITVPVPIDPNVNCARFKTKNPSLSLSHCEKTNLNRKNKYLGPCTLIFFLKLSFYTFKCKH